MDYKKAYGFEGNYGPKRFGEKVYRIVFHSGILKEAEDHALQLDERGGTVGMENAGDLNGCPHSPDSQAQTR